MRWIPEEACRTAAVREALERHNRRVGAWLDNWYARAGVQWTPGMIVPPEVRHRLDTFLPWNEIRMSLTAVGRAFLPVCEWLPNLLNTNELYSIVDLWEELPAFAGRIRLDSDNLLPFFCACADPPRYGTLNGRYPSQLETIVKLCPPGGRLLDLGCGVGMGTLEAASALRVREAMGVTIEPLEVWMATNRRLPHDPQREKAFRSFSALTTVAFRQGDATDFHADGRFDIILCNGLAGGRFLDSPAKIHRFAQSIHALLAPDGVVGLANAFHEGRRPAVETVIQALAVQGLHCLKADWRDTLFKRPFSS